MAATIPPTPQRSNSDQDSLSRQKGFYDDITAHPPHQHQQQQPPQNAFMSAMEMSIHQQQHQFQMELQQQQEQYEYQNQLFQQQQYLQSQQWLQQHPETAHFRRQPPPPPQQQQEQQQQQQQEDQVLSHAHLKPGHKATLLSHTQTLELYRQNAKKTNDPELQFEFAAFMIDAGKSLENLEARAELFDEAMKLLRKLATSGHAESQHYLAECYASGFAKGKPDFDKAFPLWVQASKHGHPDAAYRTGRCYDEGLGTRKDNARAVQFYRCVLAPCHNF